MTSRPHHRRTPVAALVALGRHHKLFTDKFEHGGKDGRPIEGRIRSSWRRRSPGSLFDTRYKGLTAHAARLDAAICRQEHLC
jgi:hypothetical protein